MIKNIIEAIEKEQVIIIFGCTKDGISLYQDIRKINSNAKVLFTDNSISKQNSGLMINCEIIKVIDPKRILNEYGKALVIIASINYYEEMEIQLLELGVARSQIIFHERCIGKKLEKLQKYTLKRMPKKELNFVVDIVEHCNLNCQNCDHFSPLSDIYYMDIESFERDIRQIKKVLGDRINHVDLEGGEPLLHDKIVDFINIIHKHCPTSGIKIFTNGILLPKMKEEFWTVCKNHKVILEITRYPIQFDYTLVEEIASEKGVSIEYFGGGIEIKTSMYKPIDLDGKQDKYSSFMGCYMANGECVDYKNGKLYPCTFAANLHIFNKYYGINIGENEKNYFDVFKNESAEELFDFLSNPIPACKFCKIKEWTDGYMWQTSRKDIKEWT